MRAAVPEARLRAMVTALAGYLSSHPGTCAGLPGALGAPGRLGEIPQASDTWIAAPRGRCSPRAATTDPRFRQHLPDQLLRGDMAG